VHETLEGIASTPRADLSGGGEIHIASKSDGIIRILAAVMTPPPAGSDRAIERQAVHAQ